MQAHHDVCDLPIPTATMGNETSIQSTTPPLRSELEAGFQPNETRPRGDTTQRWGPTLANLNLTHNYNPRYNYSTPNTSGYYRDLASLRDSYLSCDQGSWKHESESKSELTSHANNTNLDGSDSMRWEDDFNRLCPPIPGNGFYPQTDGPIDEGAINPDAK